MRAEQDGKLQPPGRNQFIGLGKFVTDDTAQGIVQGEADKQREIAAAMIKENIPAEIICKVTGLTSEQLSEIEKDLAAIKQG